MTAPDPTNCVRPWNERIGLVVSMLLIPGSIAYMLLVGLALSCDERFAVWEIGGIVLFIATPFLSIAALQSRRSSQIVMWTLLGAIGSALQLVAVGYGAIGSIVFHQGPAASTRDIAVASLFAVYGCLLAVNLIALAAKLMSIHAPRDDHP